MEPSQFVVLFDGLADATHTVYGLFASEAEAEKCAAAVTAEGKGTAMVLPLTPAPGW